MIIPQVETTPIGDYFHDSGIETFFKKLKDIVDEFETDSDEVNTYCDSLITALKGLKATTKKVEGEYSKYLAQQRIKDSLKHS